MNLKEQIAALDPPVRRQLRMEGAGLVISLHAGSHDPIPTDVCMLAAFNVVDMCWPEDKPCD